LETITNFNPIPISEETPVSPRKQPIPPPSHPRQYRAIGLIQGVYTPSEAQQITRGKLVTSEGLTIDAVILGKVISLIKNHVDFTQSYLWVVYPRTREENELLHAQIVGIWEPQILTNNSLDSGNEGDNNQAQSGYFSIRGEVVYHSPEKKKIIVKIRQSPKKKQDKPSFFKLELKGTIEEKGFGHFWDFQVYLEGTTFLIQKATNMGRLLPQKKQFSQFKNNKKEGDKMSIKEGKSQISRPLLPNKPEKSFKPNPIERPKKKA
jgi:hypothetical protein